MTQLPRTETGPLSLNWGAPDPLVRGPVIGTRSNAQHRNVLGAHSGPHATYRALAIASGALHPAQKPDLTLTKPTDIIGPYPQWFKPGRIVSLDPFGAVVADAFRNYIAEGFDIRPTIAITKAHILVPEIVDAINVGRLKPDGKILKEKGDCVVTKAAIDQVWHLPGIASRFGITDELLRHALVEQAGMDRELVERKDLEVFLPPIPGSTVYIFGDPAKLADPSTPLTARVHDECNGSDVFGSDICVCRPYLMHAIEECIRGTQAGGVGVIVYFRKEGRALGEVTKFLAYNTRKRQEGGDTADRYFACTENVAGVQDMRFQQLMPDVLHWLGVSRIHRLFSMNPEKYEAIVQSGIEVIERIPIPPELVPFEAQVEVAAKIAAGYYTPADQSNVVPLSQTKGRDLG